jgi:hypothetical protein
MNGIDQHNGTMNNHVCFIKYIHSNVHGQAWNVNNRNQIVHQLRPKKDQLSRIVEIFNLMYDKLIRMIKYGHVRLSYFPGAMNKST